MGIRQPHQAVLTFLESYWHDHRVMPTVREISEGLTRSKGSIQNSLNRLEEQGEITRTRRGKSRCIELVNFKRVTPKRKSHLAIVPDIPSPKGLPIRGEIAAGYCHDPFVQGDSDIEYLSIEYIGRKPTDYVLKISGDSMVGVGIPDGAYVGIRPVLDDYKPKPGEIVAVWVEGQGTTLKHFFQKESVVVLEAANPKYAPMIFDLDACQLKVQGTHIFTHWQSAALA